MVIWVGLTESICSPRKRQRDFAHGAQGGVTSLRGSKITGKATLALLGRRPHARSQDPAWVFPGNAALLTPGFLPSSGLQNWERKPVLSRPIFGDLSQQLLANKIFKVNRRERNRANTHWKDVHCDNGNYSNRTVG